MRAVIIICVIALITLGVVDNLVTSSKIHREYKKAIAQADKVGVDAGQRQFEVASDSGSWTTFLSVSDIRDDWPDAIAGIALARCKAEMPLTLTNQEGRDAKTYLLWLRENYPEWDGHAKLVNEMCKVVYQRGKEYAARPPDELIGATQVNSAEELAKLARFFAEDKAASLDDKKRSSLVTVAKALEARIPTDRKNMDEYLERTRAMRVGGF